MAKFLEKPNFNFFTNIGNYIIDSEVTKIMPKNRFIDFNDLINFLLKMKKKIGIYPIEEGNWSDFGKIEDFRYQNKDFNEF